ncbi:DUF2177 domain-containing protein [Alsobacter soli]|uniref:DUF2177 domain-containing protein n=1 Tax=Alsobacter soli TaxID=2109933 RepID=A0A2T1HYB1_9HYPH|nr:DUF2177 family protein [Alsobacter soli]PSC06682.1 DUF2177 domain-containing protein [Alsobacter soli]
MKRALVMYVCAFLVMIPLDLVWLGVVARRFYVEQIGGLLLERPNLPPAVAFYALYVVGVVIFAMMPAARSGSWIDAALYGALFGFFAYATYDLTNLATLKGYSAAMAAVDIAWGVLVTAVTASLGYLLARIFVDLPG